MEIYLKLNHVSAVKNIKAALDQLAVYDLVHLDRIDDNPFGYTHVLFTNTWHSKELNQVGYYVYEIDNSAIIKLYSSSLKMPYRPIELIEQSNDDEPLFLKAFYDHYGVTYEKYYYG